jgi:hypothetical protein
MPDTLVEAQQVSYTKSVVVFTGIFLLETHMAALLGNSLLRFHLKSAGAFEVNP